MFSKINNRYAVIEQIGSGGFAGIYLALDELMERQVVLKIAELKKDRSHNTKREVRMVSKLNHRNIVRYYDLLEHQEGDTVFEVLVMEYANAGTLNDFIYGTELRKEVSADEIFLQVLQGMQYYHRCGIIHKDLKPQNILLHREDFTGQIIPKLSDFFISNYNASDIAPPANSWDYNKTIFVGDTMLTPNFGTPEYMAPEQILEGERGNYIEPKTDIWAFGIMVYETFKLKHPFGSRNYDERATTIATNVVVGDDLDISGIPAPYTEVVRLCLEKDQRKRIGDTQILIELIQKKPAVPAYSELQAVNEKLNRHIEEVQLFTIQLRHNFKEEILKLQQEFKNLKKPSATASKKELMDFVRNNEIEKCFEALNSMEEELSDKNLRLLINLQGQWTDNKTMANLGMLDAKEEALTKNRVRSALIELIASIE